MIPVTDYIQQRYGPTHGLTSPEQTRFMDKKKKPATEEFSEILFPP